MEVSNWQFDRQLLSGDSVTVRELQYLVALADTMHFGRAANACHVTQPTLSMQLKKLEQRVGGALVLRTSKGPVLTSLGHEAVARARRVLHEVLQIHDLGQAHSAVLGRPLRVGIATSIAPYVAPRLMVALGHRQVVLHEASASALTEQLKACKLDVLVSLAQHSDAKAFDQHVVGLDSLMVATPRIHAPTTGRSITPLALHALPLVVPEDVPSHDQLGLWRELAESRDRAGLAWPGDGVSQLSALALVQSGRWCCLLTGLASRAVPIPAGVSLSPVSPMPQPLTVSMRWLRNTPVSAAISQLVPVLENACAPDSAAEGAGAPAPSGQVA